MESQPAPTPGVTAGQQRIRKLPREVVDRIAAGEAVQRPAHAVKELLENSIDAGATRVDVVAKAGGLDLLRVVDDGCGVAAEDMALLCERHATSKLRDWTELGTVGTFGFRGEALAALSHVACVRVTTRTMADARARAATYKAGKLLGSTDVAGGFGTAVAVSDMFRQSPERKAGLCKPATEYRKVFEVVRSYALMFTECSFSCRKDHGCFSDVSKAAGMSPKQTISCLWSAAVAASARPVACEAARCRVSGFVSEVEGRDSRKPELVLFINKRLVECRSILKAVAAATAGLLPKGRAPWAFLKVEAPPECVDVNIDPCKAKVALLGVESVSDALQTAVAQALRNGPATSRELRAVRVPSVPAGAPLLPSAQPSSPAPKRPRLGPSPAGPSPVVTPQSAGGVQVYIEPQRGAGRRAPPVPQRAEWAECAAAVLRGLDVNQQLVRTFRDIECVGCVAATHVVAAGGGQLVMLEAQRVFGELARQRLLGNATRKRGPGIPLATPPRIADLCAAALEVPDMAAALAEGCDGAELRSDVVAALVDVLQCQQRVLGDLFGLRIDESGRLLSLPVPIDGYVLPLILVPLMLVRLCCEVPWEGVDSNPQEVVAAAATQIAQAHAPLGWGAEDEESALACAADSLRLAGGAVADRQNVVREVLVPALRSGFRPPSWFTESGAVVELATEGQLLDAFGRGVCGEQCVSRRA